jgi:hypothetical protein
MKKSITILFALIIAVNLISAVDIEVKSSYNPGDTMQIAIPDVFLATLQPNNIGIYQESAVHKMPVESGLIKSQTTYFYYAILPTAPGKYSFEIENIKYWEGSVELNKTIIKNFSIVATNSSYLSFSPGYLSVTSDFSVNIKSYNKPQEVTVSFAPSNFQQKFNLSYGIPTKTVYISIAGITNMTASEVKINGYSIPTLVTPKYSPANITPNFTITDLHDVLDITPEQIAVTILPNTNYYYTLNLKNFMNSSLENLTISSSDKEINVTPNRISELEDEATLNLTLNSNQELDAWVNISYKDLSVFVPILIKITKSPSEVIYNTPPINQAKTCLEMGGVKCASSTGESCNGAESYASDGWCCMAQCQKKSSGGNSGWIIGVLILIVIGAVAWFLYDKSKKGGSGAEKLKDLLMKRTSSYQNRMKPQTPPQEIHRGLSKS